MLADRGLEAAIKALANATPMHVALSVDVPQRPPLDGRERSLLRRRRGTRQRRQARRAPSGWTSASRTVGRHLELEITDDGMGGADPNGSGLIGLRHRVEALDGTLRGDEPTGRPHDDLR